MEKETKEKIDFLFETNPEMKEKLFACDITAIREVGSISQRGINPDDVIKAYESNDPNTVTNLYRQAKKIVGLKELYKELCLEYYKKTKDNKENTEYFNSQRKSI